MNRSQKTGGHPSPRAPVLRAVPGLASLLFALAALAFSPASGLRGFARFCPSLAVGDKGSVAALPAARPCALARFGPLRVAPLALPPGGWGFGFPPVPVARSRRALPPLPAAVGGFLLRCLGLGVRCVSFRFCPAGFVCGAFRSRFVRPVGGLRPRCVVPPFASGVFRLCGRGAVFLAGGCRPVCLVLGAALAARVPGVRGSPGSGWLCGFRSGGVGGPGGPWSGVPCAGRPVRRFVFCWRGRVVVSALSLFPAAAVPAVVGFSGGRRLSPVFRSLVAGVAASVLAGGRSVAVGCAAGADAFVRAAAPGAVVFSVAAFGSGRSAFARRSAALVAAVAAGGAGSGFVVFPSAPCPAGLVPSASASACFCGLGSGSWASAAFAAGLGLPVVVFPCGFSALPPWGVWRPLAGVWAGGFLLR